MINFPSKSVSSSTKDDRNGIPSPQGLAKGRVVSCGNGCCECLWLAPEGLSSRGRILYNEDYELDGETEFFLTAMERGRECFDREGDTEGRRRTAITHGDTRGQQRQWRMATQVLEVGSRAGEVGETNLNLEKENSELIDHYSQRIM